MKETNLRLRLVVRRHGLPEVRVLFNVPLDHEPTVAKLVELVNETIPLESGDWGLEDYVVELRDADGHAFECLHFQPVANILDKDDEVFIRPLFTEDLKKRRLSGRDQISSDGRHLMDGVPYGRPLLKRPTARPPIHISPRKRRRIAYDKDPSAFPDETDEDDEPSETLFLTQFGEVDTDEDPTSVRIGAQFEDADVAGDEDLDEDEEDDGDFGLSEGDEDEEDDEDEDDEEDEDDLGPDALSVDLGQTVDPEEIAGLRGEIAEIYGEDIALDEDDVNDGPDEDKNIDLETLDQIAALKATFPSASAGECEAVLLRCGRDQKKAYKRLSKKHGPQLGLHQMLHFTTSLAASSPTHSGYNDELDVDGNDGEGEEDDDNAEGEGEDDDADSVVRHFDQHGFPPGSIQAGTALAYMADARSNGLESFPRMKRLDEADEDVDEDAVDGEADSKDATSSSGSSSDSTSDDSSDESESDSDAEHDGDKVDSSDSDDETSSSGSDDESDSGPEVAPSRLFVEDLDSDESGSDSSSDSDRDEDRASDRESSHVAHATDGADGAHDSEVSSNSDSTSSEDTSSDSSSDSDSDPEGISEPSTATTEKQHPSFNSQQEAASLKATVAPTTTQAQGVTRTVAPGQGLSRTQKRNARRRAKRLADRAALTGGDETASLVDAPAEVDDTLTSELATRKRELLAKASSSLHVVDAEAAPVPEDASKSTNEVAPEVPEVAATKDQEMKDAPSPAIQDTAPADTSAVSQSPTTPKRRMRLDLGAGRRMLFGALGLRNPKTKADEAKLRTDLMKDVRPHTNARINEASADATQLADVEVSPDRPEEDEVPEAWQNKIDYRAVECYHEGVELSQPPFPFIQRWDPQQQGRGGKGKRKQRDDTQYYNDEGHHSGKKRRISRTFDLEPGHGPAVVKDLEIELNYDDVDATPKKASIAEGSQSADMEDLPSLPTDISSLPKLHPGEAKPGMVITWKQWLLSKATNWQPQISSLTAIVTKIEGDGTRLEVLLARRDRNLDRTEKTYDENGKRVWDRFEAPDDDDEEDDGEDQGYRSLPFNELEDVRIVQQPLGLTSGSINEAGNSTVQIDMDAIPLEQEKNAGQAGSKSDSNADESTTVDHGEPEASHDGVQSHHSQQAEDSVIPETLHDDEMGDPAIVRGHDSGSSEGTSNAQGAQHALDIMMSDANGSLQSFPGGASSGDDSPSRQLEETSQAAQEASLRASRQSSIQPVSAQQDTTSESLDNIDAVMANGRISREGDGRVPPTPTVEYPKLDVPPSSSSSVRSGRQPDLDSSVDLGTDSLPHFDDTTGMSYQGEKTPTQTSPQYSDVKPSDITPIKLPKLADPAYTGSSTSSIPSLSEVWCTAPTRKTQSPLKSEIMSSAKPRKSFTQRDEEYEAAMRKLDEVDGESIAEFASIKQSSSQQHANITDGGPNINQEPSLKTFKNSVSPLPLVNVKRQTRQSNSQFSVPEGSQVVSLLTSSPEPEFSEDYADDSIDDSYSEPRSLPRGSGWVQKRLEVKQERRATRGASMPVTEATKAGSLQNPASQEVGVRRRASARPYR